MRILLVQPKMNMRPMDTRLKTRMAPSLALLTLAKLTPAPHSTVLINENIEPLDTSQDADLVAITVTVDVFPRAVEIARAFQKRGIPVIAGGIHITAVPHEAAEIFDAVCVGMAERVWPRILRDCANGTLQKVYRDTENMRGSEIVSPAYDAAVRGPYLYTNIISASRGCAFSCDFCYNSCDGMPGGIQRPVDDVLADIAALRTRHIMMVDDNLISNPAWAREFLTRIMPLKLKWNGAVSANLVDHPDLLDLMEKSGCQSLFIGFETLRADALSSVRKRQNNAARYDELIAAIHARGIMVNASIVFGLPGDDASVFDTTLDWLVRNKVATVTAHILTPYPGTTLHGRMEAAGLITDSNLAHYNTAHVVFRHDTLTATELRNGYLDFYKRFYSFRNILRRLPVAKRQRLPFPFFNFCYRKYGRVTSAIASLIPLGTLGRIAARLCYFRGETLVPELGKPAFRASTSR